MTNFDKEERYPFPMPSVAGGFNVTVMEDGQYSSLSHHKTYAEAQAESERLIAASNTPRTPTPDVVRVSTDTDGVPATLTSEVIEVLETKHPDVGMIISDSQVESILEALVSITGELPDSVEEKAITLAKCIAAIFITLTRGE